MTAPRSLNTRFLFVLTIALTCIAITSPPALMAQNYSYEEPDHPLSEAHKKWLEEEVVYIISEEERKVFLELESDERREEYIEAFWLTRDPTPGTTINEFKEQHYKRIERANFLYGRDTSREGWQTDRGRTFILFGEPRFTTRIDGSMYVRPMQLWQYSGTPNYDMPGNFYLLFFQKHGIGEMRLYSPTADGIESLFKPLHDFQGMDAQEMTEFLHLEVDPQVAHAVWSLNPADAPFVQDQYMPNPLASEMMLAKLADAPNNIDRGDWLNKFLNNTTEVSVNYSFFQKPLNTLIVYLQNTERNYEMHFAFQADPQNMSVGEYEGKVYASVSVDGAVLNQEEESIHSITRLSEFDLNPEDVDRIRTQAFEYHSLVPIIPEDVGYSLLFRNKISLTQFAVNGELDLPELQPGGEPALSSAFLISDIRQLNDATASRSVRPFQVGNYLLFPNINGEVTRGSKDMLFVQVLVPDESNIRAADYDLVITYTPEEGEPLVQRKSLTQFTQEAVLPGSIAAISPLPLDELPSGRNAVKVTLMKAEETIASVAANDVMLSTTRSAPWIYRRGIPPYSSPYHALTLADQWRRNGNGDKYAEALRGALDANIDSLPLRKQLMGEMLQARNYAEIVQLGSEVIVEHPRDVHLLTLMASGYMGTGQFDHASRLLERAYLEDQNNLRVINLLANSRLAEGKIERARELLEQSLQIHGDQPNIVAMKERIESQMNGSGGDSDKK